MPKLNSLELKHKRKILNWAGTNWHKLKEASKVKIWCALISKELPSKIEGTGEGGEIVIRVEKAETNGNQLQAPRFAVPNLQ